jgi:hypothetical protein
VPARELYPDFRVSKKPVEIVDALLKDPDCVFEKKVNDI